MISACDDARSSSESMWISKGCPLYDDPLRGFAITFSVTMVS